MDIEVKGDVTLVSSNGEKFVVDVRIKDFISLVDEILTGNSFF